MEDMDAVVMELIVNAGEGRSLAIEAIRKARAGQFEEAEGLLGQSNEALLRCHHAQTDLIQSELNGQSVPMSLLLVHAQDHLMNAMTVKDLATELVATIKDKK